MAKKAANGDYEDVPRRTPKLMRPNSSERVGRTLGLSIRGTYACVFALNSWVPKKKRLTDVEIACCIASEFPSRKSTISQPDKMKIHRKYYNDNVKLPTDPPSVSYDQSGD